MSASAFTFWEMIEKHEFQGWISRLRSSCYEKNRCQLFDLLNDRPVLLTLPCQVRNCRLKSRNNFGSSPSFRSWQVPILRQRNGLRHDSVVRYQPMLAGSGARRFLL